MNTRASNRLVIAPVPTFLVPSFVVLLGAASSARAQVDFSTYRVYDAGPNPRNLAIGDLDGDGHIDAVVSSPSGASVLLNTGHGKFHLPMTSPTVSGGLAEAIVVADFDGDSHLDVAGTNAGFAQLLLLAGDGTGGLGVARVVGMIGGRHSGLLGADFDEDGRMDLATLANSNAVDGNIRVALGDGMGGFALVGPFGLGSLDGAQALAVADFDEDGHLDFATTTGGTSFSQPGRISILLGDGTGSFGAVLPVDIGPGMGTLTSLVAGDWNEDGHRDLAVALCHTIPDCEIVIVDGDGSAGFGAPRSIAGSDRLLRTADVDRDGHLDLVSSNPEGLSIRSGDGLGGFAPARSFVAGGVTSLELVDLDGDGQLDACTLEPAVGVHLSDGAGGFRSPFRVALPFGTTSLAAGDLDSDGDVDLVANAPSRVTAVRGDGLGGFSVDSPIAIQDNDGQGVTMADLDGNGLRGVVLTANFVDCNSETEHGGIRTLVADGSGGLQLGGSSLPGVKPNAVAVADFDEDGRIDCAFSDAGDVIVDGCSIDLPGGTFVRFGDGAGGWPSGFQRADGGAGVATGDVNGDGHADIVAGQSVTFLGDGAGHFVQIASSCGIGMVLGDVDEDGNPDLISAIGVSRGDGTGQFACPTPYGEDGWSVIAADFDEDGHVDVALTSRDLPAVSILLGDGTAHFTVPRRFGTGSTRARLVAADFDGDGHVDIATATNWNGSDLTVLINRTFALAESRCRSGNVNAAVGPVTDVLFVNGSAGLGGSRVVRVARQAPFRMSVAAPPSRAMAPCAVYVWRGEPGTETVKSLPFGLGTSCMPTPLQRPSRPQPLRVANSIGHPSRLGVENWPQSPTQPAPSVLLDLPGGLNRAATFFTQGFMLDSAAPNGLAAVTNGLIVEVR